MKVKKRNNSIIGWRKDIYETLTYLDVEHDILSSTYSRCKYITIFGREFKVYDYTFTREAKIDEKEKTVVGFKK